MTGKPHTARELVDLTTPTRLHVVGAGGAGMSAIATVLFAMGHEVSGSDLKPSRALERLAALGVRVEVGHRAALVHGAAALTRSSAVSDTNVEVLEAERLKITVLTRAEMLAQIVRLRRSIAVAGTHGKTTTSSMLALILVEAGLHPSFLIGGDVNEIGTNAAWDVGELLVVEADESDGTFLQLEPEVGIVTSVEPDHLEHYGSVEALEAAFAEFLEGVTTPIVCADDPVAARLAPSGSITYGFSETADLRITGLVSARHELSADFALRGQGLGRFVLPVPGAHNALNAAGAVCAALSVGAGPDDARRALARFAGVARRFEFRGESGGVTFVDDYAHLPGEIRAAIATARQGGFDRVVCVFQPHRYSRVAALASQFGAAFDEADVVVVTGIYGAGEAPRPGVTGKLMLDAILRARPDAEARYLPAHHEIVAYLQGELRPGDCCLTVSAGDLTNLSDELNFDAPTEGAPS